MYPVPCDGDSTMFDNLLELVECSTSDSLGWQDLADDSCVETFMFCPSVPSLFSSAAI